MDGILLNSVNSDEIEPLKFLPEVIIADSSGKGLKNAK